MAPKKSNQIHYQLPLIHRPRRLRKSIAVRNLTRETVLHANDLIYPMFVTEGKKIRHPIDSMPGQYRYSVDELLRECENLHKMGLNAVNLFGHVTQKDDYGDSACDPKGLIPTTVKSLKKALPELCVQTDVALDPYTLHGHDGLVEKGEVVNDATVEVLCQMAITHAEAGVDWVSPSDMMDGRVGAIRESLDHAGFPDVVIMSYAAKYASSFYGPFRGALDSAPKFGDKKTYQMDPANIREAFREIALDIAEGADVVMVKPALVYLDVIARVKTEFDVPLAAYNVSGEYAMICAAAERGWLDRERSMLEMLLSIKRAGADMILTYFAPEVLHYFHRESRCST